MTRKKNWSDFYWAQIPLYNPKTKAVSQGWLRLSDTGFIVLLSWANSVAISLTWVGHEVPYIAQSRHKCDSLHLLYSTERVHCKASLLLLPLLLLLLISVKTMIMITMTTTNIMMIMMTMPAMLLMIKMTVKINNDDDAYHQYHSYTYHYHNA